MKIVAISDTHGSHATLNLPKGDVLIHAGDISKRGEVSETKDFMEWLKNLDFEHKIFIAGNHDFFFEKKSKREVDAMIPNGVTYLNDSGIEVNGIRIWGSPITPWFFAWAFNRRRGEKIRSHWNMIPPRTDVLITHGPPYGILDQTNFGNRAGCKDLLEKVKELKPKYHIFGHIHEGYGQKAVGETTYINASVVDAGYEVVNSPVVFEL